MLFSPNIWRRIAQLIKAASNALWKRTVVVSLAFVCKEWRKNNKISGQDSWAQRLDLNSESPGSTVQNSTPKEVWYDKISHITGMCVFVYVCVCVCVCVYTHTHTHTHTDTTLPVTLCGVKLCILLCVKKINY